MIHMKPLTFFFINLLNQKMSRASINFLVSINFQCGSSSAYKVHELLFRKKKCSDRVRSHSCAACSTSSFDLNASPPPPPPSRPLGVVQINNRSGARSGEYAGRRGHSKCGSIMVSVVKHAVCGQALSCCKQLQSVIHVACTSKTVREMIF